MSINYDKSYIIEKRVNNEENNNIILYNIENYFDTNSRLPIFEYYME